MGLLDSYLDPDTLKQLQQLSQPSPEEKQAALNGAMLQAGLGMMAHSYAPRGTGLGYALGNGGLMGAQSYQSAIQQGQKDQMERLQMGMMLQKMKKESELQDAQTKFASSIPGLMGGQQVEAPRPYQTQMAAALSSPSRTNDGFKVENPEQAAQLESDYQKLLKADPAAAAQMREQLVQQGAIKPQMTQSQPDWQKVGMTGVQAAAMGLKGGDQMVKMADLMQPNIQYIDGGNAWIPTTKNGVPLPNAQPILKSMSPKEQADTMRNNAEFAYKTGVQLPGAGGLGVQSSGNGLTPEAQNAVTQKGIEGFNENWVKGTYQPVQDAGNAANSIAAQVQTLRNIPISTGWGTEAKATAAGVLSGLGIAPKNAEMFAANAQKFQQVASERLWTVLNAAKGPQTEGDADRARQTFASLKNTDEANAFILDLAEANAKRDAMKASFYQDGYALAKKNGEFDRVDREWRKIAPSIWNDQIMQKWGRK